LPHLERLRLPVLLSSAPDTSPVTSDEDTALWETMGFMFPTPVGGSRHRFVGLLAGSPLLLQGMAGSLGHGLGLVPHHLGSSAPAAAVRTNVEERMRIRGASR
jgi:hypothetical protein